MLGPPWWFNCKESACSRGDVSLIPGLGRFPGEGNGYLVQYSCLENSMDRVWQGIVHGSAKESDITEPLTLSVFFFTFSKLCFHLGNSLQHTKGSEKLCNNEIY